MSFRPVRLAGSMAGIGFLLLCLAGCGSDTPTGPGTAPPPTTAPTPGPPSPTPAPPPTPGPNPPVLVLHVRPDPATGPAPLEVNFNMCPSFDPDGDKITYTLRFGDGKTREILYCRHAHVYAAGTYTARICASDGASTTCRLVDVTAF